MPLASPLIKNACVSACCLLLLPPLLLLMMLLLLLPLLLLLLLNYPCERLHAPFLGLQGNLCLGIRGGDVHVGKAAKDAQVLQFWLLAGVGLKGGNGGAGATGSAVKNMDGRGHCKLPVANSGLGVRQHAQGPL